MTVFACSVTKEVQWRGGPAEVSNVYHYKVGALESFDDNGLIDELVRLEKTVYGNTVTFTKARTWGPTDGSMADNKMREVRALTGTGAAAVATPFYPELAVMIYWPLGRYGIRNHPQYLRKWHHFMHGKGLSTDGTRFTGTVDATLQAYITGVTSVDPSGVAGPWALCTADGEHEAPIGGGKVYPYLEHRQIGR